MTNDDPRARAPGADPLGEGGDPTERALGAHLPGLRLVDRDLCIDGRTVADFVGLIEGRPVLFLAMEGDSEQALLRTGDAVDFALRHADVLWAHLRGVSPGGERLSGVCHETARTVLLSDTPFSASLLERLCGLDAPDLLVLQRRSLVSEAGRSEFFVAYDLHRRGVPAPSPATVPAPGLGDAQRFLATLPAALAETGGDLVERIGRVEEGLECRAEDGADGGPGGLAWFVEGEPLCSLTAVDGHLEARLAGTDVPHSIRTRAGVDVFLDWLLAFHLERVDTSADLGELEDVELVPRAPAPILTPEEIEAFRD